MVVCEIKDLSVKLGGRPILRNINLKLNAGKLIVLLGVNGAGKSTLLKVLTRKIEIYEGSVSIHEKRLRDWNKKDLARVRAVLSQEQVLNFNFSAEEVVALGRFPHETKHSQKVDEKVIQDSMDVVDVVDYKWRNYPTLSGGEKQRVQLARSLAQLGGKKPARADSLLLLDEPTSALDLSHQHLVLATAKQYAKAGASVLAILHDLNLAARYADEINLLSEGMIISRGEPKKALTKDIIARAFKVDADVHHHPEENYPYIIVNKIIKEKKMNIDKINETYQNFTQGFQSVVLSTVNEEGVPNASYAPFVQDEARTIYVYLSDIARHSQNLKAIQKASTLFVEDEKTAELIFARKRLTYDCKVELLLRSGDLFQQAAKLFDEKFGEKVQGYHSMEDFNIYALKPEKGLMVTGFGQAYRISGEDLNTIAHMRGNNGSGHKFAKKG